MPWYAGQVEAGRRDQRRELLEEFLRREDDVSGAVAPAVLQAVEERSVGESGEPLGGDGRAGRVAAQPLESPPIARRNGHVGVQVHAAGARAALALQDLEIVRVDAVAETPDTLARPVARGDAAADRGGVERGEERRLFREPVGLGVPCETAALEKPRDAPRHLGDNARNLGVLRRREDAKAQCPLRRAGVDAARHERVEVDVPIQRVAEALHEGDGASLGASDAPMAVRPSAQGGKHGAHEDPEHVPRKGCVVGEPVAKLPRKGEDPLAGGDLGEDPVEQMRGGVGHAAAAAGGAEAAAFAREGDHAIEAAVVAGHADEAVGEDAAAQERAEFPLDEARDGAVAFLRAGQEGLEPLLDHAVEDALFGAAARVAPRRAAASGRPAGAASARDHDAPRLAPSAGGDPKRAGRDISRKRIQTRGRVLGSGSSGWGDRSRCETSLRKRPRDTAVFAICKAIGKDVFKWR